VRLGAEGLEGGIIAHVARWGAGSGRKGAAAASAGASGGAAVREKWVRLAVEGPPGGQARARRRGQKQLAGRGGEGGLHTCGARGGALDKGLLVRRGSVRKRGCGRRCVGLAFRGREAPYRRGAQNRGWGGSRRAAQCQGLPCPHAAQMASREKPSAKGARPWKQCAGGWGETPPQIGARGRQQGRPARRFFVCRARGAPLV
jgi:hypothetical protein